MRWNRREFIAGSSGALVAYLLDRRVLHGQESTRFEELRRGVGAFHGRGGTIGWLVNSTGVAVVDSQFPDTAELCLAGLQARTSVPIDVLINTHHHGDHTAGNAIFREAVKQIVAHRNVPGLQQQAAERGGTQAAQEYPDTTFDATWQVRIGDETISAKHYGPGHTGGDIVVTFEMANVAHMGDLMFNRRDPFVDRPAGASIRGWMGLLPTVIAEHDDDTIYVFGHAKEGFPVIGDREDLLVQRDYFEAVLAHVEQGLAAGRSQEEIASASQLPGMDDHAGNPEALARVLNVAYAELTAD